MVETGEVVWWLMTLPPSLKICPQVPRATGTELAKSNLSAFSSRDEWRFGSPAELGRDVLIQRC